MRPIYLDYAATTPCDTRVLEAMTPYFSTIFGNPSSPHTFGQEARRAMETARSQILGCLGGGGGRIYFTSGATESNNLALLSAFEVARRRGRRRILSLSTEHKSVSEPTRHLAERFDLAVTWLPVDRTGVLDQSKLVAALGPDVGVVVCQLANSETGVIQDVAEVAGRAHEVGALCVSDITQSIGKIPVALTRLGVDFATFNAHKAYGPKGVGAVYATHSVPLAPLILGGAQERSVRAGTEALPLIIGLARAIELATEPGAAVEQTRLAALRDRLWERLSAELPDVHHNGAGAPVLPSHLNVRIEHVHSEDLMLATPAVAFSAGSACNSLDQQPSPVLCRMGLTTKQAEESIRLVVGRPTTLLDVEVAAARIVESTVRLRGHARVS